MRANDLGTCTTREPQTGLRCLRIRCHDNGHRFGLEMPGWREKLMSKIDAEDGAKLLQALVRTFKNTEIDEEELQNAPAKLWDQFKTESANLGLDLKSIAERVRRGK